MPKRTNRFQELVTLVQRALAPAGAKVTPSAMVEVSGQSSRREIDVLIELDVGPYHIAIAVEAKDEGRKMDIGGFSELVGSYQGDGSIKVNKLVIVTHHGFTETVIERAKLYGDQLVLLTYKEAESADWLKLGPKPIGFRFAIAPHLCKFKLTPPIDGIDSKRLWNEGRVICSHGSDFGTLAAYTSRFFQERILKERPTIYAEMQKNAQNDPNGNTCADIQYQLDHHSLAIDGKTFPLNEVWFRIHAVYSETTLQQRACEINDVAGKTKTVPMAQATAGGRKIQFVFPDGLKSPKVVVRFDDATTQVKPTAAAAERTQQATPCATPPNVSTSGTDKVIEDNLPVRARPPGSVDPN